MTSLRTALVVLISVLTLSSLSSRVSAQSTVSPYFLVMVDTSGSMSDSTGGGMNSCGRTQTKMSDAKCVLQQVFNSYGEVNFGLGSFNNRCTSGTIGTPCLNGVCSCSSCATTCGSTAASGRIRAPIALDNVPRLLTWVDYTGGAACSTTNMATMSATTELLNNGGTPLGGALLRARDYFVGTDPDYPGSPLTGDAFASCRSVNVILLSDGNETCGGNAPAAATALRSTVIPGVGTVQINTYVIGFGIPVDDPDIEAIGEAGRGLPASVRAGFYATDETSLALAFSQIIADATRVEVCDGSDNDCDTRVDEGFTLYCNRPPMSNPQNLCVDPGETVCDGIDNNCNGFTDEGLRNLCGTCGAAPPEICDRNDNDCDTAVDEGMVCGTCVPNTEQCNGRDDDCDTRIDEMLTRACGTDTGECSAGTQTCVSPGVPPGMWGVCSGTGPTTEACNNRDDDCDGVIDGFITTCGSDVGACQAGSRLCTMGTTGACIGEILPTTETCNNVDDDCDGRVDELNPGGGAACGSMIGVCTRGAVTCVAGALTCTGGTSGTAETCNTRDDDCDGRTDEGNPGGGASCGSSDVGACEFGTERCVMGGIICDGAVGPTTERCNTLDDDCDMLTDEGNPEGGADCGTDTGECLVGRTMCIGGTLRCDGSIGPAMETCNGLDDDCDGGVDDEIPVGAACGSDIGECDPGLIICDPMTGMTICDGETPPVAETCNLLDDDCDGSTDEALPDGAACGSDVGVCMAGVLRCVDGAEICVGESLAGTEICDCEDNDCDGTVDEETGGSLCPGTTACIPGACACVDECVITEFGPICPTGSVAQMIGASCYCVPPRCDEADCNGQTLMDGAGAITCAPGSADVAQCTCRSNACTFACDGVTCGMGAVCDPRDPEGNCVEDSCRGLGCPDGEICDFGAGACVTDPCLAAGCAADEACRDGVCIDSCAGVMCSPGSVCRSGACAADLCAAVMCPSRQACDPADGSCVPDMCLARVCGSGTICNPVTGECQEDPCNRVRCPAMQFCEDGECLGDMDRPDGGMTTSDGGGRMDAGMDAGNVESGRRRVLASGGNLCSASPGGSASPAALTMLLVALGLVLGRRRRVRRGGGESA